MLQVKLKSITKAQVFNEISKKKRFNSLEKKAPPVAPS